MYYNRILKVWVVDQLDYFLLSVIIGSIISSSLKNYLSEKKCTERLKNSIIKKSKSVIKLKNSTPNSKKIKKIYKLALGYSGGEFVSEFVNLQQDNNKIVKLAEQVKAIIEKLVCFLRERELQGIAKIFFKNGRFLLELILQQCSIDVSYTLCMDELSTHVVIKTVTAGGILGFTISWLSAGAALLTPPILLSLTLMRSLSQQIRNQQDYSEFKKLINEMLEENEIRRTLHATFVEDEFPVTRGLKMKSWDSDKNSLPQFNSNSDQTLDEFIKEQMEHKLGLVENPTYEQIKKIINKKNIKPKAKTVYFKDFIKKTVEDSNDIIEPDIIEPEIVKATKIMIRNQEL